ncbi:MAG TPA: methionine--tRNA ligase [Streptosporangiaceae bacterium]|jgi:methionyl-tRNA synthetase|nr:methionine--tRNA ligase [Streptosporangiaceae bacterium]
MTSQRIYLSTTIPYVNSRPHIGHALELVQADVLARHHRRIGDAVRLQSGTDDNSLKNVLAAAAEGISTRELVHRNAAAFAGLREHLSLSYDDFIRTSSDSRHRPGVERLWRACEASGDLYRKSYEGLYCVGCEQFYTPAELDGGNCPEHGVPPQPVAEENWFFRLSRYGDRLRELITSGTLRIEPAGRRNEVLGLIAGGLEDFSVSRPAARARGWGIGVPGDPAQVIYVWWDALGNYITSLRYGTGGQDYQRWWAEADQRIHLVGKGVLRFHAVYWPAILLSAGEELPTDILVHDYLTVDGRKISKSAGTAAGNDPAVLTDTYGADAVRWWLLRDVPRAGDADFTVDRLIGRANDDLANGLGNLVSRVVSLAHSSRNGVVRPCARPAGTSRWLAAGGGCGAADAPEWPADAADLLAAIERAPGAVRDALARFDFRAATAAVWAIVEQANRYVDATEPWHLARAEKAGDAGAGARLDAVLGALLAACQVLAAEIWPFLPDLAARLAVASNESGGVLPPPRPLFPRIETGQYPATSRGKARFAAC